MIKTLQSLICEWSSMALRLLDRISRRKVLTCLLMAALPMAVRFAALRFKPIPEPIWDDEYSYLLGGDTLASGRLANPPHPMWVHFETFHINWLPTYVSKFPPAQAIFLAFGQRVLGHPWFGQWIGFGFMCAALCWMLQGWMPPLYALLGTLLGMAQVGIFRYWMDSYLSAAVPAMGGCLVAGSVVRLARGVSWRAAALGALGLMLLANSRPIEGLVVVVAWILVLMWWSLRSRKGLRVLFAKSTLVPLVLICGPVFGWMGYYDSRTTGSPFVAPYAVNHQAYGANPQFWLLPDWPPPVYRHEVIRNIWLVWTRDHWVRARHNPLAVLPLFLQSAGFFWSPFLGIAVLASLLVARSRKIWLAMAVFTAMCAFLLLEVGVAPHYFAPGLFALLIPAMYSIRWLRIVGRRFGPALVLLFVTVAFTKAFKSDQYHNPGEVPTRHDAIRTLTAQGGRHVVFVRFAPEHKIVMIDLVYNRADIDASQIVWARHMGAAQDRELTRYYPDRKAWILDADEHPMALRPYDPAGVNP